MVRNSSDLDPGGLIRLKGNAGVYYKLQPKFETVPKFTDAL